MLDVGTPRVVTAGELRQVIEAEADPGGVQGFNPPPRTAQLIVKFGEKVLQIDSRYYK